VALNRNIRLLLYGSNLWYLGEGMLGPLFAVFAQHVGGNTLDIAWAWAAYLGISGLLIILIGGLSDTRLNKERLMVLGYALNALFTFSYLLVKTPLQLLLVQAGLAVAYALATPTWCALYAKHEDHRKAGYEWGLCFGEARIILGIALFTGGVIVNYLSFTALFLIMGCIQVIATIYQAQILFQGKR
jgi:predicted MFS family arabinose efflux permease